MRPRPESAETSVLSSDCIQQQPRAWCDHRRELQGRTALSVGHKVLPSPLNTETTDLHQPTRLCHTLFRTHVMYTYDRWSRQKNSLYECHFVSKACSLLPLKFLTYDHRRGNSLAFSRELLPQLSFQNNQEVLFYLPGMYICFSKHVQDMSLEA